MWLSMLTADAAAQHGHEFSAPHRAQQPAGFHIPLPRNPLGALTASMQRGSTAPHFVPRRALLPKRSRSLRVTMAELKEVPEEIEEWDEAHIRDLKIPGAYKESHSQLKLDAAAQDESINRTLPDVTIERPAGLILRSTTTSSILPVTLARRNHRAKTHYRLAHPPPPTKAKKHLRPRVLLQLQQQTESGFHRPSYEVVPACRFSSNTKVGAKLTKLRNKAQRDGHLNSEDLVVVQVDENKHPEQDNEDADITDSRMAIGIICAAGNEKGSSSGGAFIYLENAVWKATLSKAGVYDLVLQGDEEQRARWFVPKAKRQRPTSLTGLEGLATTEDKKFYFTTIQPDTTKHPTVAAMTRQSLDVYDSYSRTLNNPNSTGATSSDEVVTPDVTTPLDCATALSSSSKEQQIPVDDALRRLITVSSAWLFFREGWSPFFHYSLTSTASPITPQSIAPLRNLSRSATTPVETLKSLESKSTDRRDSKTSTFQSIPKLVRSATSRSRSSRSPSQAEAGLIPFSGFTESSSSRFASLKRGRSVVSPSPSEYSSLTVTAAPSSRSVSPASTGPQVVNLEEVLSSASPSPIRSRTPEPQLKKISVLRSPTPAPESPAGSASEPSTPIQYWKQYDQLLSKNMHIRQDTPQSTPSGAGLLASVQADDISPSRRASAPVPLRQVSPRPTTVPTAIFADDIVEQHNPDDRHSRLHNWAHSLYGRREVAEEESQPPVVASRPVAPHSVPSERQAATEPPQSPTISRMQTMRASLSSRMGRRSRRDTMDGPPRLDTAATPGQPSAAPSALVLSQSQLEAPAVPLTTTTRIITTIKTTTIPSTATEAAAPPSTPPVPIAPTTTAPPPAQPRAPIRRRRLSRSWSKVKGLFGADKLQDHPFGHDGTFESHSASQAPRFDPGFHPRFLRGH